MAIASAITVARAPVALAACHHFTVAASPNPVAEGHTLTVTVSRDGAVNPSHVDVSSEDETATAGQDYVGLHRTVSFTNETKQSFSVSILDDKLTGEPTQTFRLHLSNPGGCAVNPNYVLDPDVRVTIAEDDAPGPSMPPPTTARSPTSVPIGHPASTVPPSPAATVAPSPSTTAPAVERSAGVTASSTAIGLDAGLIESQKSLIGQIAFEPNRQMVLNKTSLVRVNVGRLETPSMTIDLGGRAVVQQAKLADEIGLVLDGALDFQVTPKSQEVRTVPHGEEPPAQWSWEVIPRHRGPHALKLWIYQAAAQQITEPLSEKPVLIHVRVDPWYSTQSFVAKNWHVLPITAVVGAIAHWFGRKHERHGPLRHRMKARLRRGRASSDSV